MTLLSRYKLLNVIYSMLRRSDLTGGPVCFVLIVISPRLNMTSALMVNKGWSIRGRKKHYYHCKEGLFPYLYLTSFIQLIQFLHTCNKSWQKYSFLKCKMKQGQFLNHLCVYHIISKTFRLFGHLEFLLHVIYVGGDGGFIHKKSNIF